MITQILLGVVLSLGFIAGLKLGEIAEEELRWFKFRNSFKKLNWIVLGFSGVLLAIFQRVEVGLSLFALVLLVASFSSKKLNLKVLKPLIIFWIIYTLISFQSIKSV